MSDFPRAHVDGETVDGAYVTDLEERAASFAIEQAAAYSATSVAGFGIAACAAVATSNVALSGLQTIDGYTLLNNDRVLLIGQSTGSQNGPWVAHSGAWVRPIDYVTGQVLTGSRSVLILNGAANQYATMILRTSPATVDTTATVWSSGLPGSVVSVSSQSAVLPLRLTVGPTPPASPSGNDLWISTSWQDVRVPDGPIDRRVLLKPTVAWEQTAVEEPCIWYDGTNWNLIYAGGWSTSALGWATCPGTKDPCDPANWTKYASNPVIGQGAAGVSGQVYSPGTYFESGIVYIYFRDASNNTIVAHGSSPTSLTVESTPACMNNQQGATSIQNVRVFKDSSTYVMYFSSAGASIPFAAGLATASSPLGPFTVASGNFPLNSLKLNSATSTIDGPVARNENGTYVGWLHTDNGLTAGSGYPQDIYRAISTDKINWTFLDGATPVIKRTLPQEVDQAADVCLAVGPNGFQLVAWDALNNNLQQSVLMIAPLAPVLKLYSGGAWRAVVPISPSFYLPGQNANELLGMGAGGQLTSGNGNTANGNRALESATTDGQNTAIGNAALQKLAGAGGGSTAVGSGAMQETISSSSSTAFGYQALQYNEGSSNVAVGYQANIDAGLGFSRTVAVGLQAKANANHATAVGDSAQATAPGAIALGCDSAGTPAQATAQDQAVIGTALTSLIVPGKITTTSARNSKAALTYSASITPDPTKGPWQTVIATNGSAFTINNPTSPPSAIQTQELVIEVINNSGGALGTITWGGAFDFAGQTWASPANGKRRFARFEWNGSEWICTAVSPADYGTVPIIPSDLTGLAVWLKADALALTNGAVVSSWTDSSGNGHNATQGTTANKPTFQTNVLNGLPVVRFNGANDNFLTLGNLSAVFPTAASLFVVATVNATEYTIYETTAGGVAGHWRFSGDGSGYMDAFHGPRLNMYPAVMPSSGSHRFTIIANAGTSYEMWIDGADQGSQAASYSAGTAHVLGHYDTASSPFTGDIAELVIYNRALTSTERAEVEGYLSTKWGV